jgi:hypothetical protein
MKKFKTILSEVASSPKSAEEKRFKDQHTVELIKHPVALDSQFTGEIQGVTRKRRPADQEGDAAYDQAYTVKDKPFKMPRNVDESFEEEVESLEEKAVSQAQQKLMGMALAYKRGEMDDASDQVKDLAKSMSTKDLEDFAKTKHDDLPKKVKKEGISFKGLVNKLVSEETYVDLNEDPDEEIPMMMRQLHFIGYAADEILEYLAIDGLDPEEWWQNKLQNAFSTMQSLHSYIEGDKRMMGYGNNDAMSSYYGEEVELEEATFRPSNLKLKNGETVKLSMEDAKVLNGLMKTLNNKNKKEMESTLMADKNGFNEILSFAKEALK